MVRMSLARSDNLPEADMREFFHNPREGPLEASSKACYDARMKPVTWGGFWLDVAGGALVGGGLSYLSYIQTILRTNDFTWYSMNALPMTMTGVVAGAGAIIIWWLMTHRLERLMKGGD